MEIYRERWYTNETVFLGCPGRVCRCRPPAAGVHNIDHRRPKEEDGYLDQPNPQSGALSRWFVQSCRLQSQSTCISPGPPPVPAEVSNRITRRAPCAYINHQFPLQPYIPFLGRRTSSGRSWPTDGDMGASQVWSSALAWLVIIVGLAAVVSSSEAHVFYAGGRDGWVLDPTQSYNHWAGRNRFQVNDTIGNCVISPLLILPSRRVLESCMTYVRLPPGSQCSRTRRASTRCCW